MPVIKPIAVEIRDRERLPIARVVRKPAVVLQDLLPMALTLVTPLLLVLLPLLLVLPPRLPHVLAHPVLLLKHTVLLLEPTFSPIPQPLQGLFLVAAWGVGELVGRLCYRALLDVYIRQEAEMAGLREQVNLAMEHSYHVENERREQLIRVKSKAISPLTTRRKARGAHEGSRLDPIRD